MLCTPSSLSSSLVEEDTYGLDCEYGDDYDDGGGGGGGGRGGGDSFTELGISSEIPGATSLVSTVNVIGTGRIGDQADTHRDTDREGRAAHDTTYSSANGRHVEQVTLRLWRNDGSLDHELLKHTR